MARRIFLGAVAAAALIAPLADAREQRVQFDIEGQSLSSALVDFAVQANVSISTPRSGLASQNAPAVTGLMTRQAALRRLLAQSHLTFERIDAVTYRIEPAATRAAQNARGAEDVERSHEIVVTAARRPYTLDRFAASVTALDSESLERSGARVSNDIAFDAAGLSFTNLGPGRNKIVLRGLSDGAFSGRTEATIGIYVDDSRITYGAPDPDLQLVDIERAEILHGPQGTLYGGGAIGGIYRITPRAPNLEGWDGAVSVAGETTRNGGFGENIEGALNVPIIDGRLAGRIVGYHNETAGWLDNPSLGLRNTNPTVRDGGRITLLARLGNAWTAQGRVLVQSIDSADSQYADLALGAWRRSTHILEPHDNDFALSSLTLRGPTPMGEFSSTTSYLHHSYDSRFDATGAFTAIGIAPNSLAAFDDDNTVSFLTEEVRLTAVASPFPWSIGAYVSTGKFNGRQVLTSDVNGPDPNREYRSKRHDNVREYAVYGQTTWPITRTLSMTAGVRVFRTELATHAAARSLAPELEDSFRGHRTQTGFSPQVQISYEPTPGAFYYVLAGSGYRSGGFNTGAASILEHTPGDGREQPFRRYGSDELWNFEAGVKHRFFEDRLRLRLSTFYQRWDNIQTDQLISNGLAFTGNVGDGEVFGTEIESVVDLTDRLAMSAHVTISDTKIVMVNPRFPAVADSGLPGAPHLLSGVSLDYHHPVGSLGVMRLYAGALYVGHSNITFSNQSVLDIGGYVDATVRASFEAGDWRSTLYVDNAADTRAATFSYGNALRFGSRDLVTPLRPITVGLELARRF